MLIIAPFGIEIEFEFLCFTKKILIIAPFGIEIEDLDDIAEVGQELIIAPFGIEMADNLRPGIDK